MIAVSKKVVCGFVCVIFSAAAVRPSNQEQIPPGPSLQLSSDTPPAAASVASVSVAPLASENSAAVNASPVAPSATLADSPATTTLLVPAATATTTNASVAASVSEQSTAGNANSTPTLSMPATANASTAVEQQQAAPASLPGPVITSMKADEDSRTLQSLCEANLSTALPFLPAEVERTVDVEKMACNVTVANQSCVSGHPYWNCRFDVAGFGGIGVCSCQFNSACHGIATALQADDKAHSPLLCGPDEGSCLCRGFADCPTSITHGWECSKNPFSDWGAQRIDLATKLLPKSRQNESMLITDGLIKSGVCKCFQRDLSMSVRVTSEEFKTALAQPLDSFDTAKWRQADEDDKKKNADEQQLDSVEKRCSAGVAGDPKHLPIFNTSMLFALVLLVAVMVALILIAMQLHWGSQWIIFTFLPERDTTVLRVQRGSRASLQSQLGVAQRSPRSKLSVLICSVIVLMRINTYLSFEIIDYVIDTGRTEHDLFAALLAASAPLAGILVLVTMARRPAHPVLDIKAATCSCACALFVSSLVCLVGVHVRSVGILFVGLALCGLSEALTYFGPVYLSRASSDDCRKTTFACWEVASALGTLLGPAVATSLDWYTEGVVHLGVAGVRLMTIISFALMAVLYLALPSAEVMEDPSRVLKASDDPPWLHGEGTDEVHWIAQAVNCGATLTRAFCIFLWESTAPLVFAAQLCLGHFVTGRYVSFVMAIAFAAQLGLWQTSRMSIGSEKACVRLAFCMEVLGLLVMYHTSPEPTPLSAGVPAVSSSAAFFLTGSAIWYAGSRLAAAPMTAWVVKRGVRDEQVIFYNAVFLQAGSLLGAFVGRLFAGEEMDVDENAMVAVFLPLVLLKIVLCEVGFRSSKEDAIGEVPGA